MKLPKVYDSRKVEDKIYNLWLKLGYFNPDKLPGRRKKIFTIVIPPPNITGELHMGHALNITVQDILIRWRRLQGYKTLWLPGTDHAGIITQYVVEKELKKEGKTRFDLGREKFIKRIWQWIEKYGNIILSQLKKLGASCDWSRTRFTLDKEYGKAVETAFLHYYKKGWIYRGKRVVNWCPRCQTSLSDLELEHKEEKGKLWYIKYPLARGSDSGLTPIVVATTRPETMLGDTAVAVNPRDERYKNLIGKRVILPLVEREIPIIADKLVDSKFGTGAVKVTPAHDLADYEIGLRHNLESLQIINENGKMVHVPIFYQGLNALEARQKIVEDLKKLSLLEKVEDYLYQIPHCYRCQTTIELIPSEQWFLKMSELGKMAEKAVKTQKVKFIPKRWEKVYFDWLKNIRDWCISRQIWWGHKIPLKGRPTRDGDPDVLDTWFSSALWPFASLGWPRRTKDLSKFYPTQILSTGRDLINFWVARMIFSGMEFMKEVPFKKVYFHPLVLTKEGKKMSKSLGTGVDPIELSEKYGADATRFGITYQITGGQDIRFVEDNIIMGRKFCNKLWNASRFVLIQIKISGERVSANFGSLRSPHRLTQIKNLTQADKKILKSLDRTIKSVNKDLENFRFGQAAHKLYDFFWHDFCDLYIEKSKNQLDKYFHHGENIRQTQEILLYTLLTSLKLLHPFIPFITEEIYQKLPIYPPKFSKGKLRRVKDRKKCLMVEEWPHLK